MLIESFSVKNYRSITDAKELPMSDLSILIGPNNEGKSNILRALVMGLQFLQLSRHEYWYVIRGLSRGNHKSRRDSDEVLGYDWVRDFPLKLQNYASKKDKSEDRSGGESIVTIDFSLTNSENKQVEKIIKKKLKGNLRAQIVFGEKKTGVFFYDVANPKKKISSYYATEQLRNFISTKVQVQYISAIRTSGQTKSIIDNMISEGLAFLETKKAYQKIIKQIGEMQKNQLRELSDALTLSVSSFLPQVKKIQLDSKERTRRMIHESADVYVNDGTNTKLELKGDGIKSLIAISILQYVTRQKAFRKKIILAIEEPESHLHPDAIHRLNGVLKEISNKNQVIISTHSPLLINRSDIQRNLLVNQSQAIAAKNIAQIREILGVKIPDNLSSANLMILVEGEEDSKILKKCLIEISHKLKRAFEDGIIAFDILNGSANLSYKATQWKNSLCDVHAFLDNDDAGRSAFDTAEQRKSLTPKEVTFANMNGFGNSEIEDLVIPDTYNEIIKQNYRVDLLAHSEFRSNRKKWSDRVKSAFLDNSKRWNDKTEKNVKEMVADRVSETGLKSLHAMHQKPIRTLANALEEYVDAITS